MEESFGPRPVTLDEWVADEKARIDRFALQYRVEQAEQGTDIFPDELQVGDWDDQYNCFQDPGPEQDDG